MVELLQGGGHQYGQAFQAAISLAFKQNEEETLSTYKLTSVV